VGTQAAGSEEGTPCLVLPGLSRESLSPCPGVTPIRMGRCQGPVRTEGSYCLGAWDTLGDARGKSISGWHRAYYGLGEEPGRL